MLFFPPSHLQHLQQKRVMEDNALSAHQASNDVRCFPVHIVLRQYLNICNYNLSKIKALIIMYPQLCCCTGKNSSSTLF